MIFRRRPGRDVWHWREDCRWYPKNPGQYVERNTEKRPSGDACNECMAKDKRERRSGK